MIEKEDKNIKKKKKTILIIYFVVVIILLLILVGLYVFKIIEGLNLLLYILIPFIVVVGVIGVIIAIKKKVKTIEIKESETEAAENLLDQVKFQFQVRFHIQPEKILYETTHRGIDSSTVGIYHTNDYWDTGHNEYYIIVNLDDVKKKTYLEKNEDNEEEFDRILEKSIETIVKKPTPVHIRRFRTVTPEGKIVEESIAEPTVETKEQKTKKTEQKLMGGMKEEE